MQIFETLQKKPEKIDKGENEEKIDDKNNSDKKPDINIKKEVIGQKPYALENLGRFGHDHDHIAQPDYELVKNEMSILKLVKYMNNSRNFANEISNKGSFISLILLYD